MDIYDYMTIGGNTLGSTFFFQWEVELIAFLQEILGEKVINIISNLSAFAETYIILTILMIIYYGIDKEIGKKISINILAAMIANTMIKNIFDRRRPYLDSDRIDLLRLVEPKADKTDVIAQGFSFPSGHSGVAVSLYGSIAYEFKKNYFWIITGVLAFLVGFSRIVVGAHFPTDVICGWALGLGCIFLMDFMRKKIEKKWLFNLIFVGVASIGLFYCDSTDYFTNYGLLTGTVLAFWFEEKFVNFEVTKNVFRVILRILGAVVIFLIIEFGIKAIAGLSVFGDSNFWSIFFRVLRYFLISFSTFGLYPMVFKYTAKIGKPKE